MGNFVNDLKEGKEVEYEFAMLIRARGFESIIFPVGLYKYFDFTGVIDGKTYAFEVKNDKKAKETGNIAIEYMCNDKGSGITTTYADYWCVKIDERYFIARTNNIKKAINEVKYFKTVSGGNGNRSKMYLFKVEYFTKELCVQIK